MKYLLAIAFLLIAPPVSAATQCEVWPQGCGGLLNRCEGWLCDYPGKHKDEKGNLTHLDDINHFVSNKDAKNIDDARKEADQKVLKK